jgi:hypothetical protein
MTIRIEGSTVPKEGRYGAPRSVGGSGSGYPHRGVDHYAPKGTPVVSRESGRVVSRGRTPDSTTGSFGFWSLIDYGTHQTLIAHLDNAGGAGKGQAVVEGAILGYVGNTGNARFGNPHCHEEARLSGVAVDPARFYPSPGNTAPASSAPGSVAVAWQGLQEMLAALYGYTARIDGVPGKGTWSAMQRFLAKSWGYRGPIDGVASKGGNTWKAVQRWLAARYGYTGKIDGVNGPGTTAALIRAGLANAAAF